MKYLRHGLYKQSQYLRVTALLTAVSVPRCEMLTLSGYFLSLRYVRMKSTFGKAS